mmetsp:Transcript_108449/g.317273  ORF Transcript_108449/g.317273 Transcript_108449/m.317273 type:complete len:231 (-) Transcript_108449:908-1600(-)
MTQPLPTQEAARQRQENDGSRFIKLQTLRWFCLQPLMWPRGLPGFWAGLEGWNSTEEQQENQFDGDFTAVDASAAVTACVFSVERHASSCLVSRAAPPCTTLPAAAAGAARSLKCRSSSSRTILWVIISDSSDLTRPRSASATWHCTRRISFCTFACSLAASAAAACAASLRWALCATASAGRRESSSFCTSSCCFAALSSFLSCSISLWDLAACWPLSSSSCFDASNSR